MATEEKATDGLENSSKDSASSESITKEASDKNEKVIGPVLPTPIPSDDRQLKDQDIFVGDYHCLAHVLYLLNFSRLTYTSIYSKRLFREIY